MEYLIEYLLIVSGKVHSTSAIIQLLSAIFFVLFLIISGVRVTDYGEEWSEQKTIHKFLIVLGFCFVVSLLSFTLFPSDEDVQKIRDNVHKTCEAKA